MAGLQSGLRTGLALGQSFAQGQQRRSKQEAMQEAAKMLQAGTPIQKVYQQLQQMNPQAAAAFINLQQQGQQQKINQMNIQDAERKVQTRKVVDQAVGQIAGDNPYLKVAQRDPVLAGELFKLQKDINAENRMAVGLPLIGALRITNNPKAQKRLIEEAAAELDNVSPNIAANLREVASMEGDQLQQGLEGTVMALRESGFLPEDPNDIAGSDATAQQKNFVTYQELKKKDPEAAERFAQSANMNPEERVRYGIQETEGKEIAKQQVGRQGEAIGKGLRQAGSIGGIDRAIQLLDVVNTGGYQSAKKYVTDFLGTTPADEAEFAYLTGKNVLGQLKDVFGAQFTNEEAKRLERLEAGLGRSIEANKRILQTAKQTAVDAAKRGYLAAMKQGDEFAAQGIAQQLRAAGVEVPESGQQQGLGGDARSDDEILKEYGIEQ